MPFHLITIPSYVNLREICEDGPGRRLCPACAPTTRGMHAACPPPMLCTGGGQAWPTREPPVALPDLEEMSRLGREEFRATWMPDLPDQPKIIPSFA